jgi:hypothetical protein
MTIIQITRSPIEAALHELRPLAFQQHLANSILDKRTKLGYTGQLPDTPSARSLIIELKTLGYQLSAVCLRTASGPLRLRDSA